MVKLGGMRRRLVEEDKIWPRGKLCLGSAEHFSAGGDFTLRKVGLDTEIESDAHRTSLSKAYRAQPGAESPGVEKDFKASGDSLSYYLMASRMALICSGPVPQQPPMMLAPAALILPASAPIWEGVMG